MHQHGNHHHHHHKNCHHNHHHHADDLLDWLSIQLSPRWFRFFNQSCKDHYNGFHNTICVININMVLIPESHAPQYFAFDFWFFRFCDPNKNNSIYPNLPPNASLTDKDDKHEEAPVEINSFRNRFVESEKQRQILLKESEKQRHTSSMIKGNRDMVCRIKEIQHHHSIFHFHCTANFGFYFHWYHLSILYLRMLRASASL